MIPSFLKIINETVAGKCAAPDCRCKSFEIVS